MEKKIIGLGILLLLMCSFVSAGITEYKVSDEVPLHQGVTAIGKSLDDSNIPQSNQLCTFSFLEADTGVLVTRATDQYTDQTGQFTMPPFYINEPEFLRDSNYTLRVTCGSNTEDSNFQVIQRQNISHIGLKEFEFATDEENIGTALIWIVMIIIIAFVFSGGYLLYKGGRK